MNADGTVVVGSTWDGQLGITAFRWTSASGMVNLDSSSGGFSRAFGVSADGNVVVGESSGLAFRWAATSGMISLGTLNGGASSDARGVSADGTVVVGIAPNGPFGQPQAFRWTQATGMVSLGTLNGGSFSFAYRVSSDGNVIVGKASDGLFGNDRAFRWSQDTGMVNLGTLNGGTFSSAEGVNSDGQVVVGYSADGSASNLQRAFRWTQADGMVSLGSLSAGGFSRANAVSADGSVVVGSDLSQAFRWTQATGMQTVENWLRANGVTVPADITLTGLDVSADGSTVVGELQNQQAFVARVSAAGSGLITMQDLQPSLSGNAAAGSQASSLGNIVMQGARSRPLAHRVEPGKSCVWTAGDIGRDDHDARDGSFGLAEIGGCHRLAQNMQGSLSLGRTSSRQNLVFSGRSEVSTTYGMAELLGNLPGTNLWPSAALFFQKGDVDARRGYPNAGAQDYSSGRPDVRTTAFRLRMDWENAAALGSAKLTPYADASYSRTRIDGYTEAGGGFPARFDARTENITELRVGVDAAYALSSATKLLGRLEAAHRFEKRGASTSGTVLGLFSFNFPGQQYQRDSLRAGVGAEAKLGGGVVNAMLNATTQGAVPSYWLNLSYQVTF